MTDAKTFVATERVSRLDVFLLSNMPDNTRSSIKKLVDGGNVSLNGKTAKCSQSINAGDEITVIIPAPVESGIKAENIPLDIIYEDEYFAIINKPQGMTVHQGNGNVEGTLVNALLYNLKSLSTINGVIRPGIVHRIDKDTSGLLVVAKNDFAHVNLASQIENKTCHRIYLALLEGNLKDDAGTITTYIGRNPNDRLKMAVTTSRGGKIAITEYKVLQRFGGEFTLCQFKLQTGRTHQIRVHAKHMLHPVVGDLTYGVKKQKFNLNGQLLHAHVLELDHPKTGERMSFSAPLPDYFEKILKTLTRKYKAN